MKLDSLANERKDFSLRLTRGNAPGKIGNVCPIGGGAFFNDNQVAHLSYSYFFSPACFNALFKVPGGMSTLGFPATVTVPLLILW